MSYEDFSYEIIVVIVSRLVQIEIFFNLKQMQLDRRNAATGWLGTNVLIEKLFEKLILNSAG